MAEEIARIVNRLPSPVNPTIQGVKQPNLGKIPLRAINQWLSGDSRIRTLASQRKVSRLADVAARHRIFGFGLTIEDMFPLRYPIQRHSGAPTVTYRGADFSQMADLGDGGLRWVQILED